MATIASLIVNLGMNTAKFDKGAKGARTSLRSLAEGAVALNSAVGLVQTAGNVVGRVFDAFASGSENIDNIGKLSDRLGFTTESLVGLQHAASLAGVDSETLTGALQKMNVALAKAQQGGEAAKGFELLGLDSQRLLQDGPQKALEQIADAMVALPTPAEKAAAAVQIFGKSGAGLLTVLQNGSQGLREARKEADSLGITFDRLSAQQVEQANDAMSRAGDVVTGLKQKLVVALAPAIEASAVVFKNFVSEIKQGNILFAYTDAVHQAVGEFDRFNPTVSKAVDNQNALADATEKATEAKKRQAEQLRKQKQAQEELFGRTEDRFSLIESFDTPLERLKRKEFELSDALDTLETDFDKGRIGKDLYDVQKGGLATAMERLQKQKDDLSKSELADSPLGKLMESLKTPEARFADDLAKIESELGSEFDAFGGRTPDADKIALAKLSARKSFLESLPDNQKEPGLFARGAALQQGSAAAFSASFGAKPVDKTLSEIKDIEKEQRDLLAKIASPKVVKLN